MSEVFKSRVNATMLAKNAWDREKVTPPRDHTFGGAILIWRTLHIVSLKSKKRLEEQIEDIRNTFSPQLANQKIAEARAEYAKLHKEYKQKFIDYITEVANEKTAEVDRVISTPSDPELMSLVTNLETRTEVSDREWQAIVTKVASSHDYQTCCKLKEIAKGLGREFKSPFNPDERILQIEMARDDLIRIADILDVDDNNFGLRDMHIVGQYKEPTPQQQLYNDLDFTFGTSIPKKQENVSLIKRLKDAQNAAREKGDNAAANAISRFLYDRATYVGNQQEVSAMYAEEAESLIRKATGTER